MKVGDLVTEPDGYAIGIVLEMIDHIEVPPVARVLWGHGDITKDYVDFLKVISEGR